MKVQLSIIAFSIISLFPGRASGQLIDHLFGVHNPSAGVFEFSKLELATANVTGLETLPMSMINGLAGGAVDLDAQRYLFCTGKEIYVLDPLDIAPMQTILLPLSGNDLFIHMEYNPCDSDLYGIVNAPPDSIVFVHYDRGANTFQTLYAFDPLNTYFAMGGMSYIDPVEGLYGLEHGPILGIDIATGVLLYDSPIIDPPGENFGHIAFDCGTRQVVGTSYGLAVEGGEGKWISVIDPPTGIVTHLSNAHTDHALWKPAQTGSCVDHTTGTFYWGGDDGAWVGGNTTSGNIIYDEVASSLEPIYAINHFAPCGCSATAMPNIIGMTSPSVFPNPADREVNFLIGQSNMPKHITWSTAAGQQVMVPMRFASGRIIADVSALPEGLYFARAEEGRTWKVMVSR